MFFYCIPAPHSIEPETAIEHARRYFSPFFRDALRSYGGNVTIPVLEQPEAPGDHFATASVYEGAKVRGQLVIDAESCKFQTPNAPVVLRSGDANTTSALIAARDERDAARTAQAAAESALAEAKATIEKLRGSQERLAADLRSLESLRKARSQGGELPSDFDETERSAEKGVLVRLAAELVRMEGVGR